VASGKMALVATVRGNLVAWENFYKTACWALPQCSMMR